MTQQGIGQGTVEKRRRNPRTKVDDVAITEASGLTLGVDGYPHPLETDIEGHLRVRSKDTISIAEEMLGLQKATLFVLAEMAGLDYDNLVRHFV